MKKIFILGVLSGTLATLAHLLVSGFMLLFVIPDLLLVTCIGYFFSSAILTLLDLEKYTFSPGKKFQFIIVSIIAYTFAIFISRYLVLQNYNYDLLPIWYGYVISGLTGSTILFFGLRSLFRDIPIQIPFLPFIICGSILSVTFGDFFPYFPGGLFLGFVMWQTGILLLIYYFVHKKEFENNIEPHNTSYILYVTLSIILITCSAVFMYQNTYLYGDYISPKGDIVLPKTTTWKKDSFSTAGNHIEFEYPENWTVSTSSDFSDDGYKEQIVLTLPEPESMYGSIDYIMIRIRPVSVDMDTTRATVGEIINYYNNYHNKIDQVHIEHIIIGGESGRAFYLVDNEGNKRHFVYVVVHNGYSYVIEDFDNPAEGYCRDGCSFRYVFSKDLLHNGPTPEVSRIISTFKFPYPDVKPAIVSMLEDWSSYATSTLKIHIPDGNGYCIEDQVDDIKKGLTLINNSPIYEKKYNNLLTFYYTINPYPKHIFGGDLSINPDCLNLNVRQLLVFPGKLIWYNTLPEEKAPYTNYNKQTELTSEVYSWYHY